MNLASRDEFHWEGEWVVHQRTGARFTYGHLNWGNCEDEYLRGALYSVANNMLFERAVP